MHISDEALDEFIAIYKEEFRETLTKAEASEMASRLVTLYELLARKLPNEQKLPTHAKLPSDDPHRKIGFQT